jgi:hypothetical protein
MAGVFCRPASLDTLAEFVGVLGRFYDSNRLVIRRLLGLSVLDPDLGNALRTRAEPRREGLRVLVGRLMEENGRPDGNTFDETVDLWFTLTSFETFDSLAGPKRSPKDVIPQVQRLARAVLDMEGRSTINPLFESVRALTATLGGLGREKAR